MCQRMKVYLCDSFQIASADVMNEWEKCSNCMQWILQLTKWLISTFFFLMHFQWYLLYPEKGRRSVSILLSNELVLFEEYVFKIWSWLIKAFRSYCRTFTQANRQTDNDFGHDFFSNVIISHCNINREQFLRKTEGDKVIVLTSLDQVTVLKEWLF